MSDKSQSNYDLRLKDCSFAFILRCYTLTDVITDVVNSLSVDDSELLDE